MPRWIACRTANYAPFEDQALAHIAAVGLQWVETRLPSADSVADLAERLHAHGLHASSLQAPVDVSDPNVAEVMRADLPAVAPLDCTRLLTPGRIGDTPLELAYERLRLAADAAAVGGVVIMLETHPPLATNADVALRTLEAVGRDNLRLNFDPANICYYNEGLDPIEELHRVARHVEAIHLKDTDGVYQHWCFPALGEGVIDFEALFGALDEAGFRGPHTLEIQGLDGEERTIELARRRVEDSLAHLARLGAL